MERLWSPWRLAYVTGSGARTDGCVFCDAADDLILVRGQVTFVILNKYPYNNGHVMVVPGRHVPSLSALTAEEQAELMRLTRHAEMALTDVYAPQGINIGVNLGRPAGAGVLDHLHVHVVPRWNGDTNFMTVVGNVRVLPEDLHESAKRLRPIFERLALSDV
jgi:ATP adenylyltransferase